MLLGSTDEYLGASENVCRPVIIVLHALWLIWVEVLPLMWINYWWGVVEDKR